MPRRCLLGSFQDLPDCSLAQARGPCRGMCVCQLGSQKADVMSHALLCMPVRSLLPVCLAEPPPLVLHTYHAHLCKASKAEQSPCAPKCSWPTPKHHHYCHLPHRDTQRAGCAPRLMTRRSRASLELALASRRPSTENCVARRSTSTGLVCPMRCALSMACQGIFLSAALPGRGMCCRLCGSCGWHC